MTKGMGAQPLRETAKAGRRAVWLPGSLAGSTPMHVPVKPTPPNQPPAQAANLVTGAQPSVAAASDLLSARTDSPVAARQLRSRAAPGESRAWRVRREAVGTSAGRRASRSHRRRPADVPATRGKPQ